MQHEDAENQPPQQWSSPARTNLAAQCHHDGTASPMCSLSPARDLPPTTAAATPPAVVLRGGTHIAVPYEGVGAPGTSVGLARAAMGHYRRAAAALGSLEGPGQDEDGACASSLVRLHSRVGGCLETFRATRSARAAFSLWRVHARSTLQEGDAARGTGHGARGKSRVDGGTGAGEGVAGGGQDMLVAELKDQLRRAIAAGQTWRKIATGPPGDRTALALLAASPSTPLAAPAGVGRGGERCEEASFPSPLSKDVGLVFSEELRRIAAITCGSNDSRNSGSDAHSWPEAHAAQPTMKETAQPSRPGLDAHAYSITGSPAPAMAQRHSRAPRAAHAPSHASAEAAGRAHGHLAGSGYEAGRSGYEPRVGYEAGRGEKRWDGPASDRRPERINLGESGQGSEAGLRDQRGGGWTQGMAQRESPQGIAQMSQRMAPRAVRSPQTALSRSPHESPHEREKRAVIPDRRRSQPEVAGQEAWRGSGYLSPRNPEELGVMV